jgi:hypothetical protein
MLQQSDGEADIGFGSTAAFPERRCSDCPPSVISEYRSFSLAIAVIATAVFIRLPNCFCS